jgi:RNA polymerase sigma factor (sigma-70 family)
MSCRKDRKAQTRTYALAGHEIVTLLRAARVGDVTARNRLILYYRPACVQFAREACLAVRRRDLIEDAVMAGLFGGAKIESGLIHAIATTRLDVSGEEFSAFAFRWMRGAVASMVALEVYRCSRLHVRRQKRVKKIAEKLQSELGRDPDTEEIREAYGTFAGQPQSGDFVEQALHEPGLRQVDALGQIATDRSGEPTFSSSARSGEEPPRAVSTHKQAECYALAQDYEDELISKIDTAAAVRRFRGERWKLTARERQVLQESFSYSEPTQREIAERAGVSFQRVSVIHSVALRKLRGSLGPNGPDGDPNAA